MRETMLRLLPEGPEPEVGMHAYLGRSPVLWHVVAVDDDGVCLAAGLGRHKRIGWYVWRAMAKVRT